MRNTWYTHKNPNCQLPSVYIHNTKNTQTAFNIIYCIFVTVVVVAEDAEATPAHVDHLPPARSTLQSRQLHPGCPEMPPSGHAKVAP
jgi:hypothetical protein